MQPSPLCLADTMALRILRACPHAAASMNIAQQNCETLYHFRQNLMHASHTPLQLATRNMPCISAHERCILNALAATQTDNLVFLKKMLEWLLPDWARPIIKNQCYEIADLLSARKIHLTLHLPCPPQEQPQRLRAVVG